MEITFICDGKHSYWTRVMRDDGVTLRIPGFDRPMWIPHDLAHYVVEHALGLQRGFWGCVVDGALFGGMTVLSGRQSPRAAQYSQAIIRETETTQCGTEAEVLVGLFVDHAQKRLDANREATQSLLRHRWQPGKPSAESLTVEDVQRICAELRAMQSRWQALADGESITVQWEHSLAQKRSALTSRKR